MYAVAMSEEYSQPTLELSRTFEGWWLPERPLCCDDDYSQLHRRSRADALKCKHVETNPAALVNTIVVDIDDEEARAIALWEHEGMRPNWIAENPDNGHAHAGWVLTFPVPRTDLARLKPLKLLHATTEGLRRSCDGDEGYSGLLMKNPEHPAWASDIIEWDTYDLEQLVQSLQEHGDMPPVSWKRTKRARTQGLGRNCTLFDEARTLAYRYVRSLPDRSTASNDLLREYVRRTCHELNATLFTDPLPAREVEDIARSIHKWITTRSRMWRDGAVANAATFVAMQSARGHKHGENKYQQVMKEALEW
ncbi:replication initiation protein [Bifidobacterium longum]|uniref:Replicase n=4 Tax=root TaxID=1 RepID=Q1PC43_BIFLN|nr:replication initiation protein [Bifidobacterium longum]ABE28003.1 replicase [Bifidobacterium longum]